MQRPKLFTTITDYFLIIASVVLFILEILATFGYVELITDRMVRFSVFQIWIPIVLGSLSGHFYPFTHRFNNTEVFISLLATGIISYVIWYIFATETTVIAVLDVLAEYLWAFFLGGYVLGGLFFGRVRHELES